MPAAKMQKIFSNITEEGLAKLTSVIFLVVFAACVAMGGMGLDWLSWFFGVASGLSIWKLIFKKKS